MTDLPAPAPNPKPRYGWFRLYSEVMHDPKVQTLSDRLFRAWINLLCLASKNNGVLPGLGDVAFLLRIKETKAKILVEELRAAGLLDDVDGQLTPHNWNGRQYKSDCSTDRVKRFRNAKRNVSETPPDTDTDTDTAASDDTAVVVLGANGAPKGKLTSDPLTDRSGGRSLIPPEAYMLAAQIAAAMGLENGHPSTVGMPMKVAHWLTEWAPEIILTTIKAVMASRPNGPPNNLNYFEKPIARAHAEQFRPVPVAPIRPAESMNVSQRAKGSLIAAIDRELNELDQLGRGSRQKEIDPALPAIPLLRIPIGSVR